VENTALKSVIIAKQDIQSSVLSSLERYNIDNARRKRYLVQNGYQIL